ncbi:MAG TPA: CvpA family protein [Terriglobales bacterium]|nr:CvpA family protein [Terriglobales bacterium]
MNWLDWTILVIIVLSVIGAAAQGFFFELFSLAGVILGYLLAAWNYQRVAPWFLPHVKSQWAANAAGFFVIFIAIAILAGVTGRIARWAVKEVGLRWFDRFLGAVFGLVKGALVVAVLIMALAAFGPGSKAVAESQYASYFLVVGRAAAWLAPYELREGLRQGVKAINTMRGSAPESSSKPSGAVPGK